MTCRGGRYVSCTVCRGQGKTGCSECGQTGFFTEVHQINYNAQCTFDIDWRDVPPEAKTAAHKLGLRELATESHAEIFWQSPEAGSDHISVACAAFLSVAKVEFTAPEGQVYPALVAGLRGRILEIDPLLDKYVKTGITALMKLSKGPMARQALIDTACKYRQVRQVIAGLARSSRKTVYQGLIKTYPLILSDKYARATVKYAASAVTTLSTRPRYNGLAIGTALAALLPAIYFMTPLRHVFVQQYISAFDTAVWLIGWVLAVYVIRVVTAAALKKMLPGTVQIDKGGLPSPGMQGLAAGLTTGLAWFAIAARASERPEWIAHLLKLAGL